VTAITPQPILVYLLARLRQSYVDPALYSDADVLSFLNDAYRDACEESGILHTLVAITPVAGQVEYALPADFSSVNSIAAGGQLLEPQPLGEALAARVVNGVISAYYIYDGFIGLLPTPTDNAAAVMMHYSAEPTPFTDYGSDLDPRFPVEYADLLIHHVRWRTQLISGGAERIQQAGLDKGIYDKRVTELRKSVANTQHITPKQVSLMLPDRGIRRLVPNV